MRRFIVYSCISLLYLSFVSCSARYAVAIRADGSSEVSLSASLEPKTANLIANLSGVAGSSMSPVLDATALSKALRATSGVSAVSLKNPDSRGLSGTISITDLTTFLSTPTNPAQTSIPEAPLSASRFIRLEHGSSGGKLLISIDRSSAPRVLTALSPDVGDYLSALMAPIVTGESIGREEYIAIVSSVYGEAVASEIGKATIRVALDLPGVVTSARGGTFSGKHVDFVLPLADLLVLASPLNFEVKWK